MNETEKRRKYAPLASNQRAAGATFRAKSNIEYILQQPDGFFVAKRETFIDPKLYLIHTFSM